MHALAARLILASTLLLGGGSLALMGVFLFFGPLGLIDLELAPANVLALDAALCLAFCVQHSLMIRRGVRRRIESIVSPRYYGAVFTLASAVVLLGLVLLWQESPVVVVEFEGGARWLVRAIFVATLPLLLWGARSIPRFDPFGTDPIRARLRGQEHQAWPFAARGPYRWVRHPQYFLTLVLLWAYPDLTADRLLLDAILSCWIVLGTVLEERDLVDEFGADYVEYQRRVPMLLPWRGPRSES